MRWELLLVELAEYQLGSRPGAMACGIPGAEKSSVGNGTLPLRTAPWPGKHGIEARPSQRRRGEAARPPMSGYVLVVSGRHITLPLCVRRPMQAAKGQ